MRSGWVGWGVGHSGHGFPRGRAGANRRLTPMEFAAVNSPAAAFVAGLVTSLHCAGMCGPLACGLMPVRGDRADAQG